MNQETERVPPTGPPATAEPDSFPWPRRMTFKDMETFKLCELQYRFRKEKRRKEPRTVYQIVGDLTHMGAAEDNPVAREAQLQEQLLKLAPETRLATEGVVRELIANAHALSNKQRVKGKQKEKVLFVCEATVPGWVLTARPDETGLIPAEE